MRLQERETSIRCSAPRFMPTFTASGSNTRPDQEDPRNPQWQMFGSVTGNRLLYSLHKSFPCSDFMREGGRGTFRFAGRQYLLCINPLYPVTPILLGNRCLQGSQELQSRETKEAKRHSVNFRFQYQLSHNEARALIIFVPQPCLFVSVSV